MFKIITENAYFGKLQGKYIFIKTNKSTEKFMLKK